MTDDVAIEYNGADEEPPQFGEGCERVWYEPDEGVWFGADDHGEFRLDRGSPVPLQKGDYNPNRDKVVKYEPCNAVVKFTEERYGEVRYCTGLAVGNIRDEAHDRDSDRFCKHHQQRERNFDFMHENAKADAYAKTYRHLYQYLDGHEKILAVDILQSLCSQSTYDFGDDSLDLAVVLDDGEEITIEFPKPESNTPQFLSLWYASLMFVQMNDIHRELFKDAAEDDVAVGEVERKEFTDSGVQWVRDEHHLNLPLSRINRDYEQHLTFGGVTVEEDDSDVQITADNVVTEVEEIKPEAKRYDDPLDDIANDD